MTAAGRFVFAGGGTGGHLFPGLAVAAVLRERRPECEIVFAGSERGLERRIVRQHGYEHLPLPVESTAILRRHPLRFAWRYWQSLRAASAELQQRPADAVIGLGGFASVPLVRAAQRRSISTLLLEQNTVPGRATRWLAGRADCVCHAFEECRDVFGNASQHTVTGNPVRREVAALFEEAAERGTSGVRTILVLGGSQGSQSVNAIWLGALERLAEELGAVQVIHQTGEQDCASARAAYERLGIAATTEPFFDVMPTLYRQADLVVARAGATTLAELACAGVPAVLIPFPGSVGDHQQMNAEYYAARGAARIVTQETDLQASAERLTESVRELLSKDLSAMQTAMRSTARPDAAKRVADLVLQQADNVSRG